MTTQLLIPAAGLGLRLGAGQPKAQITLAGKPLLVHTLERFAPCGLHDTAVIVVTPGQVSFIRDMLRAAFGAASFTIVDGDQDRQGSVYNGLQALDSKTEIVVIHDAARPFVSTESIQASIAAAREYGGATVAIPTVDTILIADEDQFLDQTPDRRRTWACQTPQTFSRKVILEAHAAARIGRFVGTDDATLARRCGYQVKLVQGSVLNFKITTREDIEWAERVLQRGLA